MKTSHTDALFPLFSSLQLVATDLDGTLLRSDRTISARTVSLLQRLQSFGVTFLLVSARPPRILQRIARTFHLGGLAICCNGAIIYDLDRERFLQERLLSPQQVEHLVTLLSASLPGLSFAAESGKSVACEAAFYPFCSRGDSPPPRIVDISMLCQAPQIKVLVHHATLPIEELCESVVPLLASHAYSVTYSGSNYLEIMSGGVHKGEVLAAFCAQLNIAAQSVVAFGDMPNDLPMLQWAGLGVAVANAHPLVLQAADLITLSNDEDGVAHLLGQLMHGGEIL
jgi:Cof subfamily protein (haloacid dehalogenase superfamily)